MWIYNDGGRKEAGYKGIAGDCATRAIAIALKLPYQEVYDMIIKYGEKERMTKKRIRAGRSHPRTGVWIETFKKILNDFGWEWIPTMKIGSGCKVHLHKDELPSKTIICRVSKHYTTMINGIVHDTYDCSRNGSRCVYGYWIKK